MTEQADIPPFKQRLIEEQAQLQERIDKLEVFLERADVGTLVSLESLCLLRVQLQAMNTYNEILIIRLAM